MANQDERRFDVRMIEQRIRRGTVTTDEYRRYLDSLPDEAAEGEPSKATFVPTYADTNYRR